MKASKHSVGLKSVLQDQAISYNNCGLQCVVSHIRLGDYSEQALRLYWPSQLEKGAGHNLCLYLEQTDTGYQLITSIFLRYAKQSLGVANGNGSATCHRKPVWLRVTKVHVASWKITTFFLSEICETNASIIIVESGVVNVFHGFRKCIIRCFLYLDYKMVVEMIEMADQPRGGIYSKITRPSSAKILVMIAPINL